MSDRYLYRAKRTDNGEWVEGYYLPIENKTYIICEAETECVDGENTDLYAIEWYEVDPSTICQCTGIKDKNGNLIWENDILKRALLPTKRIENSFRIDFVFAKSCFSAIDLDGSNVTFISDYINSNYEINVIGNVFDNPELLEVWRD